MKQTCPPILLSQLSVIGYADNLLPGEPAIVPPVFQFKNQPGKFAVPPFLIAGDWLIGHQEIDIVELRSLPDITVERAGVASFFCDALPEHTLWVDDKGKVHYQPFDEAKKDIWVVVEWHLNSAITALKQGAIDHARYLAGNVVGVTNNLEPRCILAACYLRQANTPALRIIKQGAIDAGYFPLTFNLLTDYYYNLIPSI